MSTRDREDKDQRDFLLKWLNKYEQEKFEREINNMYSIDEWNKFLELVAIY